MKGAYSIFRLSKSKGSHEHRRPNILLTYLNANVLWFRKVFLEMSRTHFLTYVWVSLQCFCRECPFADRARDEIFILWPLICVDGGRQNLVSALRTELPVIDHRRSVPDGWWRPGITKKNAWYLLFTCRKTPVHESFPSPVHGLCDFICINLLVLHIWVIILDQ